jgi:hypothetical protein
VHACLLSPVRVESKPGVYLPGRLEVRKLEKPAYSVLKTLGDKKRLRTELPLTPATRSLACAAELRAGG